MQTTYTEKRSSLADLSNQDEALDSLFGSASVTDSGCYGKNLFLMENKFKKSSLTVRKIFLKKCIDAQWRKIQNQIKMQEKMFIRMGEGRGLRTVLC